MILLKPEWGGEKAEDIWALYYYLLYQVLPFSPADYLPQDEKGYYYYSEGNRSNERIYPKRSNKPCISGTYIYNKIKSISIALSNYLYNGREEVNRNHLRELLTTPVDQETLSRKCLDFELTIPTTKKRAQAEAWKPILTDIFNYNELSSKKEFPRLVQLLGVEVCPYCNRSFTSTVRKDKRTHSRYNQVDHYIPKSTHPWFAVSLLNFVPCCGNCNRKKGDDDKFVLYPYFEEFGAAYRFHTVPRTGLGYLTGEPGSEVSFQVVIEQLPGTVIEEDYRKRVEHAINKFGLDVLYRESHNAYIKGIFEQRFLISDAYLDSLCASFPDHFKTHEDVRRMLYLKSFNEDELDQAPLAKLTHDIDAEIRALSPIKK